MEEIHKSTLILKNNFSNIDITQFRDKRHFCYDDIGETFPELLEEILK